MGVSASWIATAAGKQPNRAAIECEGRAITYAELARAAEEGCRGLSALGVAPGDRVALEIEDPLDFALALHACLLGGSPAVPIDLRLGERERATRRRGARVTVRELPPTNRTESGPAPSATWPESRVATVMHTSGTTADPKLVELTYGNWQASAQASAAALGLDPAERWLCPMPLVHVGGLSILVRSLIYRTTAVLHRRFDTESVMGELSDPSRRITMVSLVPTMLRRLLDAGLRRPPSLRWALVGGAPVPDALVERSAEAGVPVAPTYGMTEACSQLFTFGQPLTGVELQLVDDEVWVRGPMIAPGMVDEQGWLRTGDEGRLDERGRLEIVGRRSDTIITGGENVAPQEVEAVLMTHPQVADAAVIGRPHPEWGQAVVALVVPRNGTRLNGDDLRAHCRGRLAGFKVPKDFEPVDHLPRTNSGKLLRREIG